MAANDVLLKVDSVWQKLGANQVLEGVSFEVRDRVRPGAITGQVVGLLGPSGVGKTRLLRLIAGLDAPDRGTITGPEGKALVAGETGVVFQNYPLLRHHTVYGNMMAAGAAAGLPHAKAKERAATLLERFGLTSRAGYYPAQLSGGQRQRVAIAQQLVRQTRLVLMDEPFSGLDPASLDSTIRLLIEVANMDELNTIMVVTHDIRAALTACDTMFVLGRDRDAKGQIVSGAKVLYTYDLVERGLAWQEQVERLPAFVDCEREIKGCFKAL
ncbi:MAG TPA: ATP-binding cassette domain-containing protein [Haliangiales bacterium]|nr:ATP-binding cassette domain-containing protein [Haliangiales bacterium]